MAQTRAYSVALGYHLTFLAVSVALLGVGVGAVAKALLDLMPRSPSSGTLAGCAAVATLFYLLVGARIDPVAHSVASVIGFTYVFGSLPYALISWVIVRALSSDPLKTHRFYAADLAGAALGGMGAYFAVTALGASGLFALAASFDLLASALLLPRLRLNRVVAALSAGAVLTGLFAWKGDALSPVHVIAEKPILEDLRNGGRMVLTRWDPQARVDVIEFGTSGSAAPYDFLLGHDVPANPPKVQVLRLDLDAATAIFEGGVDADLRVLDRSILAAPYQLLQQPDVLVIGPGGGIDLLAALTGGARHVTGVEVNQAVIGVMREQYRGYTHDLYDDRRVTIASDEARSFVRRSNARYDAIILTVVDSWAALAAGSYSLSESYLYTEEAFADYLGHLSSTGLLSIGRWYRDPPTETLRTVSLAAAGLRAQGVSLPDTHIVVLRNSNFGLTLVRASAYGPGEIETLEGFAKSHGFTLAYDPRNPTPAFLAAMAGTDDRVTDDRPFFFDATPISALLAGREPLSNGYRTMLIALFDALALAFAAVILPLHRRLRGLDPSLRRQTTVFGICLGFGFIAAEVVLLQRLTLYLGRPSLALAVGLGALLGGAAIGSGLSRRVGRSPRQAALISAVGISGMLLALPVATGATLSSPIELRVLIAVGLGGSLGATLGITFPTLLKKVAQREPRLVTWAWAVNSAASVVGAIASVGVALSVGFTGLAIAAVCSYLVAAKFGGDEGR